jgi:hypothetical protein
LVYVGLDWKHLLIKPRDTIIAYVYINEVIAVGFNTRMNLGGRFPIDTMKKVNLQPYEKVEIFIATDPFLYGTSPSSLGYTTR